MFAQMISRLFDPPVLGLVILLVAIGKSPMTTTETIYWVTAVMTMNGLIPFLFYVYFTKKGIVFDETLDHREVHRQRVWIFMVFLVVVALEFFVLAFTKQYQPLMLVFTGGFFAIALGLFITYFWKISLHSALTTFFVMMLVGIFGLKVWPIVFFIPLVIWARLIMKRHTMSQLFAGSILALVITIVTFSIYRII